MRLSPWTILLAVGLSAAGSLRGETAGAPVALTWDAARATGRVMAVGAEGKLTPLVERPGFKATGLHQLTADGRPALLILWRDAGAGSKAAAELLVLGETGAWERVPRGETELPTFERARLEVRETAGRLALVVDHRYAGENAAGPVAIRELWRPSMKGLYRDQEKLPLATGVDERLNLAGWLLDQGRPGDAAAILARLPKDDVDVAERAALLLARHARSGPTRAVARTALAAIAGSDSPRAADAANQLLALGYDEVGVRGP